VVNQSKERLLIARVEDVLETKLVKMTVSKHDYLVIHYEGNYYVVDDKCPHLGGSLSKGRLENQYIQCPLHKAKFNVTNGEVVNDAKIAFITMKVKNLKTYSVIVENNQIFIEI